jgi:hypothetical protein
MPLMIDFANYITVKHLITIFNRMILILIYNLGQLLYTEQ